MRAFLSKFLLSIFIVVFAFPVSLLAQENSWTPPSGPPLGNNTPAPINEGIFPQTKRGGFRLDSNTLFPGASFQNFLPSFFMNNVQVGTAGEGVGPTLSINGSLKFRPAYVDGTSTDTQPQVGYVLTALDTEGTVGWVPAAGLPNGGNQGDTLIWDSTCNCWTTGPGGGTGGANLPTGTLGQTMWHNGTAWEATDQIKHGTFAGGGYMVTRLSNPAVQIPGPSILIGSNNSLIPGMPSSTSGTRILSKTVNIINGLIDSEANIASKNINIGSDDPSFGANNLKLEATDISFNSLNQLPQNVNFESNNINFGLGDDDNVNQTTTFYSDAVKFRNINATPGAGRIPYAIDDEGTFKWNDRFTYNLNQDPAFPASVGQLTLFNPDGGIAVFRNEGMSSLADDVVIGEQGAASGGELYLRGLSTGSIMERTQGLIQPLCYVYTTKRVVTCDTDVPGQNPGDTPILTPDIGGSVTYTSFSTQQSHVFDFTGDVEVKYCGGGGGGGGGGIGSPSGSNNETGFGANGGGGGSAGDCEEVTLSVTPGDELTWSIGAGGNGGNGAMYGLGLSYPDPTFAQPGQNGQSTSIFFRESTAPNPSQLGPTVVGGFGGGAGRSPEQGAQYLATNGSTALASGTYGWWFNGAAGRNEFGVSNTTPTDVNTSCVGCGGRGGFGEAYNENGSLRTPDNNPILNGQPGFGGNGGYDNPANQIVRHGQSGGNGALSFGGGGGGGSHGRIVVFFQGDVLEFEIKGGDGGDGGSGYVTITGIGNTTQTGTNMYEFTEPGTYTFNSSMIPSGVQNITVEVWGAGGGGGGVETDGLTYGGGGGAGGYSRRTIPVPGSGMSVIVGAGGNPGQSSVNAILVTNGSNGGLSKFGNITGNGGLGGEKDYALGTEGNENGTGGAGGSATGGQTNLTGFPGENGSVTNNPADGGTGHPSFTVTSQSYGAGGKGGSDTGPTIQATAGANGRVRITW
jgi:hypothetical protein